jgi:hypothetical protein
MAEEYSFKQEKCYCGADLSGLQASPTSNRYGTYPQAKCPECGRELLLNAPPVMPSMEPPGAEAAAAETRRSRKSKD